MKTVSLSQDWGKAWLVLCVSDDACAGWVLEAFLNCFPPNYGGEVQRNGCELRARDALFDGDRLLVTRNELVAARQISTGPNDERAWLVRCCRCGMLSPARPCFLISSGVLLVACCAQCATVDDHGEEIKTASLEHLDPWCVAVESFHSAQFVARLTREANSERVQICRADALSCLGGGIGVDWPVSNDIHCRQRMIQAKERRANNPFDRAQCDFFFFAGEVKLYPVPARHLPDGGKGVTADSISLERKWRFEFESEPAPRATIIPSNQFCFTAGRPSGELAWSGRLLAVESKDGKAILVFDTEKRCDVATWPIIDSRILSMGWSCCGTVLYASHENGCVFDYSVATAGRHGGRDKHIFGEERMVCRHLTPHPRDPDMLAGVVVGTNHVRFCIWRRNREERMGALFVCPLMDGFVGCEWSLCGKWILFRDKYEVRVWSLASGIVEVVSRVLGRHSVTWIGTHELVVVAGKRASFSCSSFPVVWDRECVRIFDGERIVKTVTPLLDANECHIVNVAMTSTGTLAVVFSNGHILFDPDVRVPDIGADPRSVKTFHDDGEDVRRIVQHLREPVNRNEFVREEKVPCREVWLGRYKGKDVAQKETSVSKGLNVSELLKLATTHPHRNLLTYEGYCISGKELYLYSEWIRGGYDLTRFVSVIATGDNALSEYHRVHIVLSVARALKWLHAHGVIHGDIKPDNVVGDAEFWVVKLIDLGLSRFENADHELGMATGLYYPRDEPPSIVLDVRVFHEQVVTFVCGESRMFVARAVVDACGCDLDAIHKWLKSYRFYLLRHSNVYTELRLSDNNRQREELRQCRGSLEWDQVSSLLRKAGATLVHLYLIFKVYAESATTCVVACLNPENGPPHPSLEVLFGSISKTRWRQQNLLDVRHEDRLLLDWIGPMQFYGPAVMYVDNSYDVIYGRNEFPLDDFMFDFVRPDKLPPVDVSRIKRKGRLCNAETREPLPWCLSLS